MAEQQQEQDRSEPATPFKLREAQKRGQVSKSMEVNSFFVLATALLVLYFMGEHFVLAHLEYGRQMFSNAHLITAEPSVIIKIFEQTVDFLISAFWPLVGALMLVGILSNIFQTGPIFSFFPIKPDMKRLNPIAGFKRLFSKKLLFESLKTFIKLFIFGVMIYLAMKALIPGLLMLIDSSPDTYALFLIENVRTLMYKLLIAVLLIALIDLAYTKWDFKQRMRMSRRELKEEIKRREGDPQVRARLRELQKEAVKRAGTVQRIPDADVLITNPTHLSVALKYERNEMNAPIVIAKGAGDLALKMRFIAKQNNVVIIENKSLARRLFRKVDIDQSIPDELFPVVAKILAWVLLGANQKEKEEYRA